jgi:hypothetical protein
MVEEFQFIDVVFEAVDEKVRRKYVEFLKRLPRTIPFFDVEWSIENPYVKAKKKTKIGVELTMERFTGGFLMADPFYTKTLIVMFPLPILTIEETGDDIPKIVCALNHHLYHELIHWLNPELSESWVEAQQTC